MQKNRLAAFLDEYFPEYQGVFKDLLGKAIMVYIKPFAFSQRHKGKEHRATDRAFKTGQQKPGRRKKSNEAKRGGAGIHRSRGRIRDSPSEVTILRELQFYKEELEKIHQQMEKALRRTQLKDIILSIPG